MFYGFTAMKRDILLLLLMVIIFTSCGKKCTMVDFPLLYQNEGIFCEKTDFIVGAVINNKTVLTKCYDKIDNIWFDEFHIQQAGKRILIDFNENGKGVLLLCGDISAGTEEHLFFCSDDCGKTWEKCAIDEPSYTMITDLRMQEDGKIELSYLSIKNDHDGADLYEVSIEREE